MLEEGIDSPLGCCTVSLKTGLNLVWHVRWYEAQAASMPGRIRHTLTGPAYEKENLERNVKMRREKPTHEKHQHVGKMQVWPAWSHATITSNDCGNTSGNRLRWFWGGIYLYTQTNLSQDDAQHIEWSATEFSVYQVKATAVDSILYFISRIDHILLHRY